MRKSFRKSLDKIGTKRNSKSRDSIESAGTDNDSIMANSIEIIDEQNEENDQQKRTGSPAMPPLLANPNLMLELNAKLGMQRSSEFSEKTGTPPPIPSSPKPALKDSPQSPPSFTQEQKPKSKIPRLSRTDSLVETKEEPVTEVKARKVSISKIPKMIGVKSSPDLISSLTAKSENQRTGKSLDIIEDLETVQKARDQEGDTLSAGLIIQPGSKSDSNNDASDSIVRGEENKTKRMTSSIPKLVSSSTIPKNENKRSSQEKLIDQDMKTETEILFPDSNTSFNVTNEEIINGRRSSIPKLMSTIQTRSTLDIPDDTPRSVSLPSVMASPGKVPENEESSRETKRIGSLLTPRKVSTSKIPQPVDFKNERKDLIPAQTTPNKEDTYTLKEKEEELKDSKVSAIDDKITIKQTPEIENSSGKDSKDPVVLKVPRTQKRSVHSIMLDDALSEFQKEIKSTDGDDKE